MVDLGCVLPFLGLIAAVLWGYLAAPSLGVSRVLSVSGAIAGFAILYISITAILDLRERRAKRRRSRSDRDREEGTND